MSLHLEQAATAARTHAISGVELETLGYVWQSRLRCRSRSFGRLLRLLGSADLLRLILELLRLLRQALDQRERLLQLVLVAGVERERVALALELLDQLMDLGWRRFIPLGLANILVTAVVLWLKVRSA